MGILNYFDRMAIVHLPDREDRFRALRTELSRIDIDINGPKVIIPDPPMPVTPNGFKSCGVYGNFSSHLEILEAAYRDGLETVWVLEDDAIFTTKFRAEQDAVAQMLRNNPWDMFFIGHSIAKNLPDSPTGILRYSGPFIWAHSYAVHRRILPRLIEYVRQTEQRPEGHPEGGKMYIDAVYYFFRQLNPDVVSLVSAPCYSIQKGSQSSLNSRLWYDKYFPLDAAATLARAIRDESWRQGWLRVNGPQFALPEAMTLTPGSCEPWPAAQLGSAASEKAATTA